ncbi:cell division protein FtsZ [[Haemophilus] felis]|uniref:Cell division protein FtsZ n=1 Tax=[Haemophilus] felis TaxID=123822 RepID=A0A1T0BBN6_9PAST|nr:cell division protein FtsZ [[Haemophilus] felis]NBI40000.1 cell division protein FtsZ [[Haemophilus] felis]NBI41930.1 cell division protein FtsZ [[Haemophilus] felis]OOS07608.1 cell division protein FtsZ [[Haemophilus] felis]
MFEPVEYDLGNMDGALIKVVGVGGGGGNAVNHMVSSFVESQNSSSIEQSLLNSDQYGRIEFYAVNTDSKALRGSKVQQTIQIGAAVTKGLGAGANPNIGRQAAEEDQEAIRAMLEGADMVFIAAGMGGGTGTGAAPIVAQIAKELGILTVAVVTKPFSFEGKKRMAFAEMGIKELSKYVDSLIVIPNEKLLKVLGKNVTLIQAFAAVNDVLRNAVTGISDMITSPGLIGVDFADVRTVMSEMGRAMMGTGIAYGTPADGRAEKAAQEAIASPLLEDVDLSGAKGVVVNITTGMDLGLDEFEIVGETVKSFASDDAIVIVGTALVPEMVDEIRVTIVATGIGELDTPDVKIPQPIVKSHSGYGGYNNQSLTNTVDRNPVNEHTKAPLQPTNLSTNNILDMPITARHQPHIRNADELVDVQNFIRNTHNK